MQTVLKKPAAGEPCNGCGYCCTEQLCQLAVEFLGCSTGPCLALEERGGRTLCGLVRNPLGYLYKSAHPDSSESVLDDAPNIAAGHQLSVQLASALGLGKGCDAADDEVSAEWAV